MNTNGFGGQGFHMVRPQRNLAFGIIIVLALLAFEIFNYSTTDYALADLLGDLEFVGIRWATILAIAFCGIDFAGIARLFTPEQGANEPTEVWYLFGAWLLAATMNAMLTWWGVSLAVLNHETLGNAVVERNMLLRVVPIFVAVMVWLIRVLIIGTFSVAGERLFNPRPVVTVSETPGYEQVQQPLSEAMPAPAPARALNTPPSRPGIPVRPTPVAASAPRQRPAPPPPVEQTATRPEPTYHPLGGSAERPARPSTAGVHAAFSPPKSGNSQTRS